MFGHMTDVGGKVPGSLPTDARQIYEEGICVPPVKIYKGGELQQDLLKIILHNCRLPTLESLGLQRDRRGAAHGGTALHRDRRSASATTFSTPRWTPCSSATSARCAS